MKQTILILSVFALLMAGCKSEKTGRDNGVIRFMAYQPTKVTGPNFDVNDEIAVFAPLAGQPIEGLYDTEGAGAAKNKVYAADNANMFWPKSESDKIRFSTSAQMLDFYAVYPATGPGPKHAVINMDTYQVELGKITDQTVTGNVVPYMYSNDAKNKGAASGVIGLTFRYIFSKISLKVMYSQDAMDGDTLSKVEFYATDGLKEECVIDLKQSEYSRLANGAGADATDLNPYLFTAPAKDANEVEGYVVPSATHFPMIRLTFGDPTPSISVDGDGSTARNARVYLCKIQTSAGGGYNFLAGKEYKYEIQIKGSEVKIGGTIEDWDPVGEIHIEAE